MNDKNLSAMLHKKGLFTGALIIPTDIERAAEAGNSKLSIEGYAVVAPTSSTMYDSIGQDITELGYRLTAYETPMSQFFLIATVQADFCQSRIIMHLADPDVQEMLKLAAVKGYIQILLSSEARTGIVIYELPFLAEDLEPLLNLSKENCYLSHFHTMLEMAGTAAELYKESGKLLCSGMPTPGEVTVTSILPAQKGEKQAEENITLH